jgi:hypothetical protein
LSSLINVSVPTLNLFWHMLLALSDLKPNSLSACSERTVEAAAAQAVRGRVGVDAAAMMRSTVTHGTAHRASAAARTCKPCGGAPQG